MLCLILNNIFSIDTIFKRVLGEPYIPVPFRGQRRNDKKKTALKARPKLRRAGSWNISAIFQNDATLLTHKRGVIKGKGVLNNYIEYIMTAVGFRHTGHYRPPERP